MLALRDAGLAIAPGAIEADLAMPVTGIGIAEAAVAEETLLEIGRLV